MSNNTLREFGHLQGQAKQVNPPPPFYPPPHTHQVRNEEYPISALEPVKTVVMPAQNHPRVHIDTPLWSAELENVLGKECPHVYTFVDGSKHAQADHEAILQYVFESGGGIFVTSDSDYAFAGRYSNVSVLVIKGVSGGSPLSRMPASRKRQVLAQLFQEKLREILHLGHPCQEQQASHVAALEDPAFPKASIWTIRAASEDEENRFFKRYVIPSTVPSPHPRSLDYYDLSQPPTDLRLPVHCSHHLRQYTIRLQIASLLSSVRQYPSIAPPTKHRPRSHHTRSRDRQVASVLVPQFVQYISIHDRLQG
ncbi:hypothetical protein BC938DRAFT_480927 [Jimgerdemannia flammicorona]|uniref:Uncharacterized protein n=1 Tax=Jimgerdemannia flammicorona TaxID=994334 RepID=A0A433QHI2_9FUNG|nr:hypothetical protein BC938DRAFT_480927 [Jimgerdemannia flammicorona]